MTANRYGFSAYGAQCAYERIYYDLVYGQLKTTYPKWDGFDGLLNNQYHLGNITKNITKDQIILDTRYDFFHMDSSSIEGENKEYWKKNLFYPIPKDLAEVIMNIEITDKNEKEILNKIKEIDINIYSKLNTFIQLIKYSDLVNENINNIDTENAEEFITKLKEGFESYKSKFINFLIYVRNI